MCGEKHSHLFLSMSTMTVRQARGNMTSLTFPVVLLTMCIFLDSFVPFSLSFTHNFIPLSINLDYRGDSTEGDWGLTGLSLVKD